MHSLYVKFEVNLALSSMYCKAVFASFSGLHPSKTKLELQRHLATLDNQEQASVFENTMVMCLFCLCNTE